MRHVKASPSVGHAEITGGNSEVRPDILLMDDDVTIQEIGALMLRALGYEPTSAWDGREAIELYQSAKEKHRPFAAVIIDVQIKDGMSGSSAIRHLREMDPEIKAIVSSASHGDPLMVDYADYGFKAALPKPYNLRDLLMTLEYVLKPASVEA